MLKNIYDYSLIHHVLTVTHAEGDYPIFIGENLLEDHALFNSYIVGAQVVVVTDSNVQLRYLKKLLDNFSDMQVDAFVLPEGEHSKNMDSFAQIINFLSEKKHHRDTTLIALGGGVVGDLTGFVAACYHRGVNFIQVPTTLVSQVDSSIGGKTALNQANAKNLIGAFYQPKAVIIDLNLLDTLPDREYKSGIAEIIKVALIQDSLFFSWLEAHMSQLLSRDKVFLKEAVYKACCIKQAIVMQDEKDVTGLRALLNFGHTFGHAIENNLGYGQWLHGEAVALGIRMAAHLSCQLGRINKKTLKRINKLLDCVGFPTALPQQLMREQLMLTMMSDKKVEHQKIHFVLLDSIGHASLSDAVSNDDIEKIIALYADA